jgi:hypothetical protein
MPRRRLANLPRERLLPPAAAPQAPLVAGDEAAERAARRRGGAGAVRLYAAALHRFAVVYTNVGAAR